MMPNKTIYIKDSDLPLLEQAQKQLGDSVSSMFAEFLRDNARRDIGNTAGRERQHDAHRLVRIVGLRAGLMW